MKNYNIKNFCKVICFMICLSFITPLNESCFIRGWQLIKMQKNFNISSKILGFEISQDNKSIFISACIFTHICYKIVH